MTVRIVYGRARRCSDPAEVSAPALRCVSGTRSGRRLSRIVRSKRI